VVALSPSPGSAGSAAFVDPHRTTRQQVILSHLFLAESIAHRYSVAPWDAEDIRQVAYVGLVKAGARFDPARGDDFASFATPTISGEIQRHLRDNGWVIRPPRHVQQLSQHLAKRHGEHGGPPSALGALAEIAVTVGQPLSDVREAINAQNCLRPVSLEAHSAGDDTDVPFSSDDATSPCSLAEILGGVDAGFERAELLVSLAQVISLLSHRDQQILHLRFVSENTQQDIATVLGITQMQVSRLLANILRTLRLALGEHPA
jgi:RNA polymerase sigma-B factor